MNKHTHSHNLMFLLAASPMGVGCIIVADDEGDTTAADTANLTSGSTDATSTGGTDTTPVTGDDTGSSDRGDTTGPDDTTAATDSTGVDSTGVDSTGGGASTADCQAFGDHEVKCMVPYSEYVATSCMYSQDSINTYYPDCAVLFDEFIACLTMLSCEELNGVNPCADQLAALDAMGCPSLE